MIPVFTLKLNHKILPRLITVGKYDGKHPCLTAATNGNKVFIHSPHGSTSSGSNRSTSRLTATTDSDTSLLTFGQHITALCAGAIGPDIVNNDKLIIGSQTHILAYDVYNNTDLFYKEVHDGATCIVIGSHLQNKESIVYVGGSCSVTGFDYNGEEKFWTVAGDNVHSMALLDYTSDDHNELLIGSEDYDIRIFEGEEMISEISEADAVTSLCNLGHGRFGYALHNGIVGVYSGTNRLWRSKSKHTPMCIAPFDYTNDGIPELVTGWSNGKVDIRHSETGAVLFKTMLGSHIAGIVMADYRLDGKEELICCSLEGVVRGYLPNDPLQSTVNEKEATNVDQLQDLNKKKSNLLLELQNFEVLQRVVSSDNPELEISRMSGGVATVPTATQLRTEFKAIQVGEDHAQAHISLLIETTNKVPIKTVAVFSDSLFEGESHVVHPRSICHNTQVPLYPSKDAKYQMSLSVFIGNAGSTQLYICSTSLTLPRFSLYVPCQLGLEPHPQSSVVFNVNERLERIKNWVNDNFLYKINPEMATLSTYCEISYMSLRTGLPFTMKIEPEKGHKITIATDDLDLAGDIVQGMAEDLDIEDIQCIADFPRHMEDLRNVMTKMQEFHKVRESISVDMAEQASLIKNLIVRAEDARLMDEIAKMHTAYSNLYSLNKDMIRGYELRQNNHTELLECLKILNQAIQKSARLRVGKPKTTCTNACRRAVKDMDHDMLVKAISVGQ